MATYRHDYALVPQQATGSIGSVYFARGAAVTKPATNGKVERLWEYIFSVEGCFHLMAVVGYAALIGVCIGLNDDSASRKMEFFSFFHPSDDIEVEMEHLSYFYLGFGIFFHLASVYDGVNLGTPSYFNALRSADQILSVPFIIAQILMQLGLKDIIAVMAFSALAAVAAMILSIQEHANAIREEQMDLFPVQTTAEEARKETPTPGATVGRLPFSRTTRYTILSAVVWATLWAMIIAIWGHVKARGDGRLPESYVTVQVWLNLGLTVICLLIHIIKAVSKKPFNAEKTRWAHSEGVFAVFLFAWKFSHSLVLYVGTRYNSTDKLQSYDNWVSATGGSGGGS
jgi:hypothetical protein